MSFSVPTGFMVPPLHGVSSAVSCSGTPDQGSLTEDEIVQYVQDGHPNHRDWDEWSLRMTFRINSFLREQGPVGEPDLVALGFLDD